MPHSERDSLPYDETEAEERPDSPILHPPPSDVATGDFAIPSLNPNLPPSVANDRNYVYNDELHLVNNNNNNNNNDNDKNNNRLSDNVKRLFIAKSESSAQYTLDSVNPSMSDVRQLARQNKLAENQVEPALRGTEQANRHSEQTEGVVADALSKMENTKRNSDYIKDNVKRVRKDEVSSTQNQAVSVKAENEAKIAEHKIESDARTYNDEYMIASNKAITTPNEAKTSSNAAKSEAETVFNEAIVASKEAGNIEAESQMAPGDEKTAAEDAVGVPPFDAPFADISEMSPEQRQRQHLPMSDEELAVIKKTNKVSAKSMKALANVQ